jgi:hypothetical protein
MNHIRVLLSRPKANRLLSLMKHETIASTNEGQDHHIPRLCRRWVVHELNSLRVISSWDAKTAHPRARSLNCHACHRASIFHLSSKDERLFQLSSKDELAKEASEGLDPFIFFKHCDGCSKGGEIGFSTNSAPPGSVNHERANA